MSVEAFDPAGESVAIRVDWNMSTIRDERLRKIHEYWQARARRGLPSRADIDPLDVPALLPFICLIDVIDSPRDFRFRLAGTHLTERIGMELTGRRIGEVFPPAFRAEVHYHWNSCIERRAPLAGSGKLWVPGREHVGWEGIVLPLSPDNDGVNMLLGGGVIKLGSGSEF